jgi:uncharacterized protein (TIGR00730 family)
VLRKSFVVIHNFLCYDLQIISRSIAESGRGPDAPKGPAKKEGRQQHTLPITGELVKEVRDRSSAARTGNNMVVFCAGITPKNPLYTQHALELGKLIGERGHNLVWGATDHGTMKAISSSAKAAGALLLGVGFAKEEPVMSNADVLFGAQTLEERKDAMLDLGDVAIALAGGIGTLDEIATVIESRFSPPVVLVNTDGFYEGFYEQMARMCQERFTLAQPGNLVRLAADPLEAITMAEDAIAAPFPAASRIQWPNQANPAQ